MRVTGIRLAAAAALMCCAVPSLAHEAAGKVAEHVQLPDSARAPAAVVDAFHDALRRGDTGSAAALIADDALIFESGGVERSKAEYSAQHLRADAEFERTVGLSVKLRTGRAEGSLAWIATEGRLSGTFEGKPVDRVATETMILRRTEGGWKIVHIHWSSAAAR